MVRAMEPIQSLLADDVLPLDRPPDRPRLRARPTSAPSCSLIGFVFLLNSVINVLALRAVGEHWRIAFLAGFALAQVGEFAFVLSQTAVSSGLIGEEAQRVVVAVIAMTMMISPLVAGARPPPACPARRTGGGPDAAAGAAVARRRRACSGVRSERVVRRGSRIVQSLSNGLERALRSARQEPGRAPAAPSRPPVAERPARARAAADERAPSRSRASG